VSERPTKEGGVWGSYVDYLASLEAEVEGLNENVVVLLSKYESELREADRLREALRRVLSGEPGADAVLQTVRQALKEDQ
jgi:hypothetical protein